MNVLTFLLLNSHNLISDLISVYLFPAETLFYLLGRFGLEMITWSAMYYKNSLKKAICWSEYNFKNSACTFLPIQKEIMKMYLLFPE